MTPALALDLRCEGCGAGVTPDEEGRCAFCRMEDRGDGQLLSHDVNGWVGPVENFKKTPWSRSTRVQTRVPCRCGCGMSAVPEPAPPPPADPGGCLDPAPSENGMTTIGGSMDCKAYGCSNDATATMGPYAGLCDEHAEVARKKRSDALTGQPRGGGGAKAASNGKGYAGQIKTLLGLARKVDRAHSRLAALPEEPDPKLAVDEAIRRYQGVPSAENLAALNAATKVAKKGKPRRALVEGLVAEAEREFKAELAAIVRRAAVRD